MKTKQEVINYINSLDGYKGYVQFAHRPIDKDKDLFYDGKKVKVDDESGFIYEAHFCNGTNSIQIRQINNEWKISQTDISNVQHEDTQVYISDITGCSNIRMAQIWEEKEDKYCENMKVKKLSKVVFAEFEKGDEQ